MGIWWDISAKIETYNGDIWGYKGNIYIYIHIMTDGNSYRMGLRPHLHEALCYKDVQFSILSFEVYGTSFGVTPRGHFSLLSHNKLLGYPSSWKRCKGKSDTIHGFKSLFISKSPLELSWVQDPQTTHRCSYLLVGYRYGGFLSHRATPSHHPFFFGIFPWIFLPSIASLGYPPTSWGHEGTHPMPSRSTWRSVAALFRCESWWVPRGVCYLIWDLIWVNGT